MSVHALSQKKIALLACSGFDEQPFVALQQTLVAAGASVKVISRDHGLTNGWANGVWGLSYPVDGALSETLAIDYDVMVVPTGERHTALLLNDPHGHRIINAFLREDVPSLIVGSAVDSLAEKDMLDGFNRTDDDLCVDKNLVMASEAADTQAMIDALNKVMINEGEAAAA
jgi:putative intracellular protease/amidase